MDIAEQSEQPSEPQSQRAPVRLALNDRRRVAIREMKAAGVWPIVLNVAQYFNMQPTAMVEFDPSTREARSQAWAEMMSNGISATSIAGWWGIRDTQVIATSKRADAATAKPRKELPIIPDGIGHFEKGFGVRRDDCKLYRHCLDLVPAAYGGQCRCPLGCKFYKEEKLKIEDYLRPQDVSTVPSQARNVGRFF